MFQTKSIAFFALPFASILLLDLEKYFKGVSSLSPHQALVGSGREVQDWVQMVCVCLCVCVCVFYPLPKQFMSYLEALCWVFLL